MAYIWLFPPDRKALLQMLHDKFFPCCQFAVTSCGTVLTRIIFDVFSCVYNISRHIFYRETSDRST